LSRGGATRFAKGQSGNPKGRPRKARPQQSAFDIVIDRTFTVAQNGVEHELTVEEALQQRTYQDALAGSRSARREVLKMIAKREKWLAAKHPVQRAPIEIKRAYEGRTADDALRLLGIACQEDMHVGSGPGDNIRLKLEPWVVQLGLKRGARRGFTEKDVEEIKRCTRVRNEIDWP
jgi:hypothetical protein